MIFTRSYFWLRGLWAEFELSEIRNTVSKMTASAAVGVLGKYLIISLGDNNDHLSSLGEREFYQRVRGDLAVLLKQLDQGTRDKVVPAFRDGQVAVVLDLSGRQRVGHAFRDADRRLARVVTRPFNR